MNALSKLKYWLRLQGVSRLSWLWNRAGGSPLTLARRPRLGSELLIGQLASMTPGVPLRAECPLRIVFFTMLGSHSYMVATEIALARALKARGHEVRLVLCDRRLPLCENKSVNNRSRWDFACYKCFTHGHAMLRASGLDFDLVSRLTAEARDPEAEAVIHSLDFHHTVESSLYKYFKIGRLRGGAEEAEAARGFSAACDTSARAALAVARRKPDRVVMSHGVYATWAPALGVFQRFGIPVAVYNKGKRRNSSVMNWVSGNMDWDVSRAWAQVKDQPLTPVEDQRLQAYLDSRVDHSADALKYNFGERESLAKSYERLRLDPNRQTFVLFTNVLWDAASAQKEIAFPNAVDWVMETIEWFGRHPEKQLVVKVHPAEVVIGTNQPFAAEIRERFPQLPPNVRLIEPQEKVNSWSIMRVATAGLVHTSTPGLELPLEGIPCICVSGVHYRGKGFTVDVESKEEYFRLLSDWDPNRVDTDRIKTLARRYAYLLFERYHLPWDFLHETSFGLNTAFAFASDAELLRQPTVDLICRAIEQRSDFLRD